MDDSNEPVIRTYLATATALYGAMAGSWASRVAYRVSRRIGIFSAPPSFCDTCTRPLQKWEEIPILGWLLVRRKCRACGAVVPVRYPLFELGCAVAGAATSVIVGARWELLIYEVALPGLAALLACDFASRLLPRQITAATTVVVVGASAVAAWREGVWWELAGTVAGSLWLGGLTLATYLVVRGKETHIGQGDVRLFFLLGALAGWSPSTVPLWRGIPLQSLGESLSVWAAYNALWRSTCVWAVGVVMFSLMGFGLPTKHRRKSSGPWGAYAILGALVMAIIAALV